jgi:hypothetical protein
MSGKVQSLYDQVPQTAKLRKDQEKRITEICRENSQYPKVALGLVRDYIHGCSAKNIVEHIKLSDDRSTLSIYTIESPAILGTRYHFRFEREPRLEAPTLYND